MEFPSGKKQSLFAEDGKDYGYSASDARKFLEALTRRLQVSSDFTITAYEDIFFTCGKNGGCPKSSIRWIPSCRFGRTRPSGPHVRTRLRTSPSALCFRLRRIPTRSGTPRWTSQPWFPLAKRMFLTPGDSPMGYRLPLEALPWTKPEDVTYSFDTDPFRWRDKLPQRPERRMDLFTVPPAEDDPQAAADKAKPKAEEEQALTLDPARRSACRRARESSVSSCRRSTTWRTISTWSPPSKTPRPISPCRCRSKAIPRPTTPASRSLKSLPIPG